MDSESTGARITITGIAEIVLNVRDMAASLAFYRDLLGLAVISPPAMTSPIFLKAGMATAELPAMIVLVQLPSGAPAFTKPRPLHHLALALPAAGFDLAERVLTHAGYAVRGGKHPVLPSRTMYVDDPDGNEVELIAADVS
ncbi:MAG: VOC family protein [Chloroflexia bacterium]|nr:VOC family protein [Chloroflexia bacterium]MDQ3411450.1 VOC family protein [Chloroflexota bacterium]